MSTTATTSTNNGTSVPILTPSRASSGSQAVVSNESTPSTSTSCNAPQPPGTEDFHVQLDGYLLQDKFDDCTLYGRISDVDPSSPLDLEAEYEARAHVEIEAFNADFHNAHE